MKITIFTLVSPFGSRKNSKKNFEKINTREKFSQMIVEIILSDSYLRLKRSIRELSNLVIKTLPIFTSNVHLKKIINGIQ